MNDGITGVLQAPVLLFAHRSWPVNQKRNGVDPLRGIWCKAVVPGRVAQPAHGMEGAELRELKETLLPDEVLRQAVEKTGLHHRDRKRDALVFLRTMLLSASSPSGAVRRT